MAAGRNGAGDDCNLNTNGWDLVGVALLSLGVNVPVAGGTHYTNRES